MACLKSQHGGKDITQTLVSRPPECPVPIVWCPTGPFNHKS